MCVLVDCGLVQVVALRLLDYANLVNKNVNASLHQRLNHRASASYCALYPLVKDVFVSPSISLKQSHRHVGVPFSLHNCFAYCGFPRPHVANITIIFSNLRSNISSYSLRLYLPELEHFVLLPPSIAFLILFFCFRLL